MRGATINVVDVNTLDDISTHAPLAGRDTPPHHGKRFFVISTHAPLAGRDSFPVSALAASDTISTHAPLAGRDSVAFGMEVINDDFNPRAPCGARPARLNLFSSLMRFQPTRPLRGATIMDWFGDTFFIISTHAPLAGRDAPSVTGAINIFIFQPTRPLRGATKTLLFR